MRTTILAVGLMAAATAVQAQQDWVEVASGRDATWEVRAGSVRLITNDANEPAVVGTLRVRRAGQPNKFEHNYVRLAHCQRGYGKLVTLDLDGRFRYDNDWVASGGSVAAGIAETLCAVADSMQNPQPSPGTYQPGRTL